LSRHWLAPLTPLYAAGVAVRNWRIEHGVEPVRRLRWPVVSVGNLSTGGSGKTPLTIALARALSARGLQVDVLSRGYGRTSKLAARVRSDGAAEEFGDEPLLIARETDLPVYVAPQRYEAGLLAEAARPASAGAAVHLLDDGFQHRQLHRDVDILLLNRQDMSDRLLPAGNLREPLRALARAAVLAVPADEPEIEQSLREIIPFDRGTEHPRSTAPLWKLKRTMEIPAVRGPVAAFCGIARPEQFFRGLEAAGLQIALRRAFPDHFAYTRRVLEELLAEARAQKAEAILTTGKDLARMGELAAIFAPSMPLITARLRVEIEDEEAALNWLIGRIRQSAEQDAS